MLARHISDAPPLFERGNSAHRSSYSVIAYWLDLPNYVVPRGSELKAAYKSLLHPLSSTFSPETIVPCCRCIPVQNIS
jgi:hypothetical protein